MARLGRTALPNDRPYGLLMEVMMTRVLGIDVGLTGALAVVEGSKLIRVWDMPTSLDGKRKLRLAASAYAHLAKEIEEDYGVHVVVIEGQGAAPGQGLGSTFYLGMQAGFVEGVAEAMGQRVEIVKPHVWKAGMRLSGDKELSRQAARKLWPASKDFERKKDHGRAEAALLARWWILAQRGKEAA